ncbi:hypothetical protein BDV09DRAFT_6565 [Aspergillus tetrazonus]
MEDCRGVRAKGAQESTDPGKFRCGSTAIAVFLETSPSRPLQGHLSREGPLAILALTLGIVLQQKLNFPDRALVSLRQRLPFLTASLSHHCQLICLAQKLFLTWTPGSLLGPGISLVRSLRNMKKDPSIALFSWTEDKEFVIPTSLAGNSEIVYEHINQLGNISTVTVTLASASESLAVRQ